MANFNTKNFLDFKTNYTLHNGEVIDENTLGLAPLRLKKELNNVYNIQRISNGLDPLPWNNVETYLPGEIVIDDSLLYRSKMVTFNNKPSSSPTKWEHIMASSITSNINVIDNLNSTSSTDALSANQGRILKDDLVAMSIALG